MVYISGHVFLLFICPKAVKLLCPIFKDQPLATIAIFISFSFEQKCLELNQFNGFDTALISGYLNPIN